MPDCLFCKIIAGEIPCYNIYEDDSVIAFLDIHPLNPGHALVVPKQHAENVFANAEADALAAMRVILKLGPAILAAVKAPACNISANVGRESGQVVFHTHFHIIPRVADDGYAPWDRREGAGDLEEVAKKIRGMIPSSSL